MIFAHLKNMHMCWTVIVGVNIDGEVMSCINRDTGHKRSFFISGLRDIRVIGYI
jgi:hypothetical protein